MSAERYLISAVLRAKSYSEVLGYELTPDMFESYPAQWEWVLTYITKYRRLPPKESFRSQFPDFPVAKVDDAAHQASEVRSAFVSRSLQESIRDVAALIQQGDLDLALRAMQESVVASAGALGLVSDSDAFRDFSGVKADVEEFRDRIVDTGSPGISTGFKSWDAATGGLKPGELVTVGARLGVGKSWLLTRMCAEATVQGYTAIYDSLEMSRTAVVLRLQTITSKLMGHFYPAADLLIGSSVPDLNGYDELLAFLESSVPGSAHVADQRRGRITLTTLAAQIERIQPDVVFVDYLQLLDRTGEWQSTAHVSNSLAEMATRYSIPIVAAFQLNRAAGLTRDVPGAEAAARSDSIGQDSDQMMNSQAMGPSILRSKLVKSRNGAGGGEWYVDFQPGRGIIDEISKEAAQALLDEMP